MKKIYKTKGTCSSSIEIETSGDTLRSVRIVGGCNGNGKGISSLVEGMKTEDVIQKLSGLTCDFRSTSCPDQLAKALIEMKKEEG